MLNCDECSGIFLEKKAFLAHKHNVHTKRYFKPKTCKFCKKEFANAGRLRHHVLFMHEENKLHQCDLCPRKFALGSKLRAHIKLVHERVKCEICRFELCNFFLLTRHKAQVHGIKPKNVHDCDRCDLFFKNKISLIKHIDKKHNSKPKKQPTD